MIFNTINRDKLAQYLTHTLNIIQYSDYCPNGLQVEGNLNISFLISGVTASLALINMAKDLKADAILVHHGVFWTNENVCIVGFKKHRLKILLTHNINLFAYHLPLDHHIKLGNNAQLGHQLGLIHEGHFGKTNLGWIGRFNSSNNIRTTDQLIQLIKNRLGREPLVIADNKKTINKVAWCSGAAQDLLAAAADAGATVFISGEISESTLHIAQETGITYIMAGHHVTERYGIQALGQHIASKFNIRHQFIELYNPA